MAAWSVVGLSRRDPFRRFLIQPLLAAALLFLGSAVVLAQEEPAPETSEEASEPAGEPVEGGEVKESITVTGTRFEGRSALLTPAPVDYLSAESMAGTGALETGQILQRIAPSANFSTTTISDGTDAIRPATLRGTGPDQTLLLFNGKRYHQQALVHYQQTIGRGSAGFDLNTIPVTAIDHVEVLRDGAAAQYGSDAIAGVVNIILKEQTGATDVSLNYGQMYEGDGELFGVGVNTGFEWGDEGFVNLTVEYRDRAETNRAGVATTNVFGWYSAADFAAGRRDVKLRIGDPDAEDLHVWLNASRPVGESAEFYAVGGWSTRETNSSGFYRGPNDGRTVPEFYPDGFLPTILTEPEDQSLLVGWRDTTAGGWRWDASLNYGMSEFAFREENTVNVSFFYEPLDPSNPTGPRFNASPTAADTGTLSYDQLIANLDFAGQVDWGVGASPLNVAFGAEWRTEGYEIEPGEPVSYQYGRTNNFGILILNQNGGVAAPGTQGFPGFQEAVDEDRDNIALYADFESQLTRRFLGGLAVRYEDYSDFGSTVDWKVSGRLDVTDKFAVRGTVQTGFRAPGVQQAFFTLRSTNLDSSGTLADTLTAANNSPVARSLGIPSLTEETAQDYTLGFVARPSKAFRLTVDAYKIDIDDRIVFSDAVSAGIPAVGAILGPLGIGQVQFFTNAIDTTTEGLDIVGVYETRIGRSPLAIDAAIHFNETEVTRIRSSSAIIPASVLFPEAQVTLVERGQPRQHYSLGATLDCDDWSSNLRFSYFGAVEGQWFTQPFRQKWGGAWLTDLSVSYRFNDATSVTLGGMNVLDEYPDKWDPDGAFPFPQGGFTYGWETLPFGINGGYYFARVNYRLKHGS